MKKKQEVDGKSITERDKLVFGVRGPTAKLHPQPNAAKPVWD